VGTIFNNEIIKIFVIVLFLIPQTMVFLNPVLGACLNYTDKACPALAKSLGGLEYFE
jgi:hypothetical protein